MSNNDFPNAVTNGNNIYFLIGATNTEAFGQLAKEYAFAVSPSFLAGVLVHELFHVLGASDTQLIERFKGDYRWDSSAGSGRVSTILGQDCFGGL